MKQFTINQNDAGQRLDRFIGKAMPLLPSSLCQKYIRKKRIKINGKSASQNQKLVAGDVVTMYINDEFFTQPSPSPSSPLSSPSPASFALDIIYEDKNILLLNKPAGMLCHAGARQGSTAIHDFNNTGRGSPIPTKNISDDKYNNSLISEVLRYLQASGGYDPSVETTFVPALCNRIDRNTSGIVIAAKNAEALRIINEKLRLREIDKFYLAAVDGRPNPIEAKIEGFWTKDKQNNKATIVIGGDLPDGFAPSDSKRVITEYKTLTTRENISLVECKLITGRSHQIRAHLSAIGHPIVGDKKYGCGKLKGANNNETDTFQALCSYKLRFSFKTDAGILSYHNEKTFIVKNIPFLTKYFGDNFRL